MLPSAALNMIALLGFAGVLAAAAVSDVRRLRIPNRYCLAIVLLYGIHVLAAPQPVDWTGGLAVGGATLAVAFVLFIARVFGGGDAKLLAATSLWAGPGLFSEFVFSTAVAGALLAIVFLLQRRAETAPAAPQSATPADPQTSEPSGRWQRTLPYGVAIALGGAHVAVMLFLGR